MAVYRDGIYSFRVQQTFSGTLKFALSHWYELTVFLWVQIQWKDTIYVDRNEQYPTLRPVLFCSITKRLVITTTCWEIVQKIEVLHFAVEAWNREYHILLLLYLRKYKKNLNSNSYHSLRSILTFPSYICVGRSSCDCMAGTPTCSSKVLKLKS